MVDTVVEQLGGLHIAINNAGLNKNNSAEDTTEDEWDATFELNTKAVFLCSQVNTHTVLTQPACGVVDVNLVQATAVGQHTTAQQFCACI